MSTLKKLLALSLALAMVLSASVFAGYLEDKYQDAANINKGAVEAVELMTALNIMKGVDAAGTFAPNDPIDRASVAKMIYVILNSGTDDGAKNYTNGNLFTDVPAGHWAEGYINYCAATNLVAGRGNGTFGPSDKISATEVAKMLLTAIGYSAELRGYVGTNWSQNVLSDAAVIGLFDGYDYPITAEYAPRQWVAVMFYNALTGAYTYSKMAAIPVNGMLTATNLINGQDNIVLFGAKYFNFEVETMTAMAISDAWMIKPSNPDDVDYVVFGYGSGMKNQIELSKSGLGAADLGQRYRVVYNTKNNRAIAVTPLSDVVDAKLADISVRVNYGTSQNAANNKYVFTINGEDYLFAKATGVPALQTGFDQPTKTPVEAKTLTPNQLYDLIKTKKNTDEYRFILNSDGDIAYVFVTNFAYAEIDSMATHKDYGTYLTAKDVHTKAGLKYDNGAVASERLYVKDTIVTDDELAKYDIVKYHWSLDDGKYAFEVLPVEETVEFEAFNKRTGLYVLGGDEYQIADRAEKDLYDEKVLVKDNVGKDYDIVCDGDLLVLVSRSDSNYTDIADVNEQLVLVLDADDGYSNGTIRNQNGIIYMTIDGEIHTAVYQDGKGLDFSEIGWTNLRDQTNVKGRLFILHEGTKNRVYLEALETDADKLVAQLSVSKSVLNGYQEIEDKTLKSASSITLNGNPVASDNLFFFTYVEDGELVAKVIKASEMGKGQTDKAYAQVLTLTSGRGTRTEVVAGYISADLGASTVASGYLYIEDFGYATKKILNLDVVFSDGKKASITVPYDAAAEALSQGVLYGYAEDSNGNYKLTEIQPDKTFTKADADKHDANQDKAIYYVNNGVVWVRNAKEIELDKEAIAVRVMVKDRDSTQGKKPNPDNDKAFFGDYRLESIEFMSAADLDNELIAHCEDTTSYLQNVVYNYEEVNSSGKVNLLYVTVYRDMTQAQPNP